MKNQNFCKYNLASNNLGDEGAKEIGKALSIGQNGTGETNFNSANASIISLNLSANAITNVGMNALIDSLQENESLIELNISSKTKDMKNKNKLTQEGLKKLQNLLLRNQYLNILDISGNAIKEQGARLLAEAYERNEERYTTSSKWSSEDSIQIQSLNLSSNEICTVQAYNDLRLILLKGWNLKHLDLSFNKLGD